jgi:hypothetical protein
VDDADDDDDDVAPRRRDETHVRARARKDRARTTARMSSRIESNGFESNRARVDE